LARLIFAVAGEGIWDRPPHELRHRYASLKLREDVRSPTRAELEHAKKSLTVDTYSHMVVDE